jgi:hypothetical protein
LAADRQPCTWIVWSSPPVWAAIIAMWLGVLLEAASVKKFSPSP